MSKFSNKKILVIGDVMLDHYIKGSCNRISPEAPVQVVDFENEQWLLGGAANVANNLIEFGSGVVLCGVIGIDKYSDILEDLLNQRGIENLLIKSSERKTTVKSRVISNGHQLLRIDNEVKFEISSEEGDFIFKNIETDIENYSFIVLSDYAKGLLTKDLTSRIMRLAKKKGIPTIVDPKKPPLSKYNGVKIIKPNKREASIVTGIEIKDHQSLEAACKLIVEQTKCEIVVVTLSELGVAYFQNNLLEIIPTRAKEVFDVTGAGDTFLAGLVHAILNGQNLYDACEFANYASAVVVAKYGCTTASLFEISMLKEKGH